MKDKEKQIEEMNEEKQITPLCDEEYCFLPIIYKTNEMCKYCIRRTKEYEK